MTYFFNILKNFVLISRYNEYLLDNEEISIDKYIFNVFIQDLCENKYDVPYTSFFILRKIIRH